LIKLGFILIIFLALTLTGCGDDTSTTPPTSTSATLNSSTPPTLDISSPIPTKTPVLTLVPPTASKATCKPTFADPASPTYKADAPTRSIVGQGLVLRGVVRSSLDCGPIARAKLEFWPEAPDGGHPDQFRSTLFTDQVGTYQFQCNPTDHIHMHISATGFTPIFSNVYHPQGKAEDTFDIVLAPLP